MNRTIKEALRIAQRRNKPIRFHQTIARRGYATDGAVEGVPDEESQEKFLKEQLEGSAPQYDPEAGLLTGKRAGLMAAGFAPGSGIATAAGKFPTAEGGYEPSVREDIREKRYGSAALKALGAAGDVAYAAPVVGPVVGAAMKAPLAAKLVMAAAPIAKAAHEIAPVLKEDIPLMAVSNITPESLDLSVSAGGFPGRSVAIKRSDQPFKQFGEIGLIGEKAHATPSEHVDVYQGDSYSSGPVLQPPYYDAEQIAADMRRTGRTKIEDELSLGPAEVRAFHTPKFETFEDVKKASHLLTSREKEAQFARNYEDFLENLKERMLPFFKKGSGVSEDFSFYRALTSPELRKKHFKNLPDDIQQDIDLLPLFLRNAPQEYFESKIRGVSNPGPLSFKGAVVPEKLIPGTWRQLKEMGITDIAPFEQDKPESQLKAYEKFKNLRFEKGGSVISKKASLNSKKVYNKKSNYGIDEALNLSRKITEG